MGFVHDVMQALEPTLDVLAFAGVEEAIARAEVEFPLPDLPQLGHEVATFLAGVGTVSKTMLNPVEIVLVELVEALIAAEILTILTLVLVLLLMIMIVLLRHRRSPDGANGRGGEKDTQ